MGLYLNSIALFVSIIVFGLFLYFCLKKSKYILIFLICFTSFYAHTTINENNYKKNYETYGNKKVLIQAIIMSNPEEKEYKNTYEIKVVQIENIENKTKSNKSLNLLCNIKKQDNISLKYGDKIEFTSIYELPSTKRNEGGFDYMQYLKTKKISGIVDVSLNEIKVIEENKAPLIKTIMHNLKNSLIAKITQILPKDTAGICIGLLLGDKTLISEEIQNNFKQSSLSHMLAISGAHISYILLGITTFLHILKFHKRWSKIIVIVFLIFFMALVGFTPSVTRACIMSIISLLAGILFRKPNIYQNLAISSIIILLINPYSLLDIGFQLSFGGTIGIVLLMKNKEKPKLETEQNKENNLVYKIFNYIKQIIKVSISANLVILPIMIYHFNTISATFLISNILASPILAISLILGLIFIIFSLIFKPIAIVISYFLNLTLQSLIQITNFASKLPYSQILISTPRPWQIALYYLILLNAKTFSIKYFIKYKKVILIIQILILIFPYFIKFPTSNVNIYFIDVGQGDSTLIETPSRKTVLIDGGGSEFGTFDVGEKTLLPYLLDKNITKIDYIMFSHFDSDHCGGLLTILKKIKVKNIIISKQGELSSNFKQLLEIIKNKNINIIIAKAGDTIKIDNECYFNILFPENDLISENILNNNSIVAKFCYQNNFSMLFTGDVEKIAENRIAELYKNTNILNSTILKIAHHGSKTSSTEELLKLISPKIALIGVGGNNKFGHPSDITIQNLEKLRLYYL